MTAQLTSNKSGRPPKNANLNIRERLFDAAKELFGKYDYATVSTRRIAEKANTTPAMIRYYFGNKEGLHYEVILETGKKIHELLQNFIKDPKLEDIQTLFMEFYNHFFLHDSRVPALMMRNLFNKENDAFVAKVVEGGPAPTYSSLSRILRTLQKKNEIRADLDCELLSMQIMGMCAYPCLFNPMLERVMDRKIDRDFFQRLAKQNYQVLLHSIQPE